MTSLRARLLALALLAALSGATPASVPAADDLPPRNQALLLLRVLAYDRNLRARAGEELVVAVAYRDGDEASARERDAIAAELEEASKSFVVSGLKVRVRKIAWRGRQDLQDRLAAEHAAALYVGSSLAPDAAAVGEAARVRSALSFAPSREMVHAGLALGLVNRGSRAGLLVNLSAARAEGADLDSALLAMVEIADKR